MAKKKSAGKLGEGTRIRIRDGVTAPEFPDVSCAGWTGTIADVIGKKAEPQFVVEWDAATLERLPAAYREQCEQRNLLYTMACFPRESFDVLEE